MNNGKYSMQLEITVLKILDTIFLLVMNEVKNISDIIHAETGIVLCVKIMPEKNGFRKNLVTY